MPRSKRVRIAEGVYRDKAGVAIVATVRGLRREQRLPPSTVKEAAQQARRNLIRTLEDTAPESATHGTLAADVAAYLAKLPKGRAAIDRADLLQPWVTALGDHAFALITRAQVLDTLLQWEREGLAPASRNKRLSALRVLWRTVTTDPDKPHPCERVGRVAPPKAHLNRARRLDLITRVLEHCEDTCRHGDGISHAKAQLTLLAWTGHPASLLSQIRPEHVRWRSTPPEVYLQPRRKGKGVDAAWVPLLPEGAAALKAWLSLNVWGQPWHAGVLRTAWLRAVKRTQAALTAEAKRTKKKAEKARLLEDAAALTGMRVYDLRHSMLTALAMAKPDIYAVAEYARHADIRTTQTYIRGASSHLMKDAVAALSAVVPREKPKSTGRVVTFRR